MKTKLFLLSLFLLLGNTIFSQEHKNFKEINIQIWKPFTEAFETYDYKLFASIHSKDLVRVSGNSKSIKGYPEYIEGYKRRWQQDSKEKQTISFRFLERIVTDNYASERGIYKLTIKPNTDEEKSYYGKFHVILKKEQGVWKLQVDYDSTEQNTITEISYKQAYAIDDFEKY